MSRKIRGIRDAIPPNTVIGRTGTAGNKPGAPFLIDIRNLATKQYVAQTAGLPSINDGYIIANISGGTAVPIGNAFSAVLDYVFSNAQGSLLYRDSAVWKALAPGTANYLLKTGGAGANPAWVTSAITQSTGDNSTNIATTAFVTTAIANAIAGVNPAVSVKYATTAAGDTSGLTYNNGASGIGATFTGANNTVTTIDGHAFVIGDVGVTRVLIKNDTQSPSGAFNGVYLFTALHTSITGDVFTRALDYDQSSDINNTGVIPVVSGTANTLTSWLLTTLVTTVGTDPLTYAQFSFAPVSAANPTGTGSDVANNGVATTYMRSDATFAIQKGTNSVFGLAKGDGTTVSLTAGIASIPSSVPLGGSPTTTTQASSDSSTKIATTAFVQSVVTGGYVPTGAAAHPGFQTGNFYGPYGYTGALGSINPSTGTIQAVPFYVPVATTFTKIGIHVSANVALSHIELGIYANSNGVPGALVQDCGQVSSASNGDQILTGLTISLAPGWYWLAMSPSANGTTIFSTATNFNNLLGATTLVAGNVKHTVAWVYSTGNLPNPFGTSTPSTAAAPWICLGL